MFVLAVLIVAIVFSISDAVTPCKLTEADCLTDLISMTYPKFIDADPQYGTENLDPMYHEFIDGNLSIIKYKLFNSTVTGFRNCVPERATLKEDHKIHLILNCPKLIMYGQYDLNGRLIVLPVEGNGEYRIDTNKYRISIEAETKTVERDGKNYFSIRNFKLDPEPLEPVKYDFKNLFNGQKDLANAVLKFANENWKEVSSEIQNPVLNADIKKIVKNANKYFKHVPLENLVTP